MFAGIRTARGPQGQPKTDRKGPRAAIFMLADVIELHALIIGATAAEAADQLRNPRRLGERDRTARNLCHYQRAQAWRSRQPSWRTGSQRTTVGTPDATKTA
jgi:hypothetical protein